MPLPDNVQIGPLVFRVTDDELEKRRADATDGDDTFGRIEYGKGLIILDYEQSASHKRMALLHECLHGCWHVSEPGHLDDEDAIRRLSAPLLDMLRRNPVLVAYLLAEE
jgi:hypothetical protein